MTQKQVDDCLRRFCVPTLYYESKNSTIICGVETPGKVKTTVLKSLGHVEDELFADQNRYFVPRQHSFEVYESFTGKEVFSVALEGEFKRYDYFPKGKIRYSRCFNNYNSSFPTGRSYTNASELDVKFLVILERERHELRKSPFGVMESHPTQKFFSAFTVFDVEGKRLFKWDTREKKTKNLVWKPEYESEFGEAPEVETPEVIESVAFLTEKDLVFTIFYDNQGYPGPDVMSYFVHVNISTGCFKALYPSEIDPKGPVNMYPVGEIFALPGGDVVSLVTKSYTAEASLERLWVEKGTRSAQLKHSPVYPNFFFHDEFFWFFPPLESGGNPIPIGFEANHGEPMIILGSNGEQLALDIQASSSAPATESKLLIVTEYPSGESKTEPVTELIDVKDNVPERFIFGGKKVVALGEGLVSISSEAEGPTGKGGDSIVYSFDTKKWEHFNETDIQYAFSLKNSKSWKKFLHDSLKSMTPELPSDLSGIIVKFI